MYRVGYPLVVLNLGINISTVPIKPLEITRHLPSSLVLNCDVPVTSAKASVWEGLSFLEACGVCRYLDVWIAY